jgi:glucose-1-phosphate cytidylyltransferase
MQVVILCGGKGTRIRDVAEDVPKPMIQIGGRPILWHIMKGLAHHGFTDFILCLGHKSWVIKEYFLNYALAQSDLSVRIGVSPRVQFHGRASLENWTVTLAETGLETMTGGRLKRIEPYIQGDHFLLTYGDGVSDVDLDSLVNFHRQHGNVGTVTAVRAPSRFGEIDLDGTKVVEFNEKPLLQRGRINGGFLVFQRRFLERLPARDDLVLEQEPLMDLARDAQLGAYLHDGFWHCMDSSRDYEYLNRLWASGAAPWQPRAALPQRNCA